MKDFIRVIAAVPFTRPTKVQDNYAAIEKLFAQAVAKGADAVVFPELSITGATCGDLFFDPELRASAKKALCDFAASTAHSPGVIAAVGLPISLCGRVYNCAAVVEGGIVRGVIPKTILSPLQDSRWFASDVPTDVEEIDLAFTRVPFGRNIVFNSAQAVYAVEIGSDSKSFCSPVVNLSNAGANIILHLDSAPETVGSASHLIPDILSRSRGLCSGYVSAGAGVGESSTDFSYSGPTVIAECGSLLESGEKFSRDSNMICSDIDVDFIAFERSKNASFRSAVPIAVRRIQLSEKFVIGDKAVMRKIDPTPFVPAETSGLKARIKEVLAIQSSALATRLSAVKCKKVIVGVSGGLDSALALIVCVETFKRLNLDPAGIIAVTMPGFGTTGRTKNNAENLCKAFGATLKTIDITHSVRCHFNDIGHDENVLDITYENAQARNRTYILMDLANKYGALLIGTGDLSELALGWCTYNGDQMSMYGVNASVPKTLVRAIVSNYYHPDKEAVEALADIADTPVSPELLPSAGDGTIAQKTEDKVGPYELHDFFIYHYMRRGANKDKIRLLSSLAFAGKYSEEVIDKWLDVFFKRFYAQQFKRSCMPDGPAVGSIGLSPRGMWAMPSDIG